ncbi:MAG: acyl-CoA dehydratase activase [Acidimicrobiia bacterium]|jgi:predicted CoA-substrate-specific enzyme activase
MSLTAGIDLGSSYTKVVVVDEHGFIESTFMRRTGFHFAKAAEESLQTTLAQKDIAPDAIGYIAATGFGRYAAEISDLAITELTCHAYAVHKWLPEVRTVLDAGGQTVKALRIDEVGRVTAFRLNDKCAAGAGAFLQKTVEYLGYDITDIAPLSAAAEDPVTVSSVCTVFAESEIINHLAADRSIEDVCAGAVIALTGRAAQLVKRVKAEPPFGLTGGLASVDLLADKLGEILGSPFAVPPDGLGAYAGAYGAALLAHQRLRKRTELVSA